ncbi:MAG: C45 family autoproteolytic acyltransferase/hydrolase [Bacteroidales bacterium]
MKKFFKYTAIILLLIILLPVGFISVLYMKADMGEPTVKIDTAAYKVIDYGNYTQCNKSMLRKNSSGIWELYTEGDAVARGAETGALTKNLMRYQEDVFIAQIREIIPSDSYLKFLRTMIMVFNRNLGKYIDEQYRTEIYASSLFCTHEYDAIGNPYERQLNYHAAHDIGHTMQQYMLVGCSSFAAWGTNSLDSTLIVGRNFDFYVGDDFAKNKLITFCAPSTGYRFASIGWPGMTGVLSGMNETGLTVTINAAKGALPTSAATPISIVTREILQYASTVEEAYKIAADRQTFVSESILISSATDKYAAIIEKTPHKTALYKPSGTLLLCTNHYQSALFADDPYNQENIAGSDSQYRWKRLEQLTKANAPICVRSAAAVLRNQQGLNGEDVGLANEMTLNQSIAHHSVIFKPEQLKMWVSTTPWQAGKYICYDLNKIFGLRKDATNETAGKGKSTILPDFSTELQDTTLSIAADSLYLAKDYKRIIAYRQQILQLKHAIGQKQMIPKEFIHNFETINPENYYTYKILADYYMTQGDKSLAKRYYKQALDHRIPYLSERTDIEKLVNRLLK